MNDKDATFVWGEAKDYTIAASDHSLDIGIQAFPQPTWKLYPFGRGVSTFEVYISSPPNAFHRLMQRLILGHVWERL